MKAVTSFCTGVLINLVTLWGIAPTEKFVIPIPEQNKVEVKQLPMFYGELLGYETVRNTLLLRYMELDNQMFMNDNGLYPFNNDVLVEKRKIIERLQLYYD